MTVKKSARFRIQAVAEKTGVPAATLRAWERRYGVPLPRRTQTAYRMYSDEDVRDILKLRALCRSGMSVGEAAATVRGDEEVPLAPRLRALSSSVPVVGSPSPSRAPSRGAYAEAIARFVQAACRMDVDGMNATLAPLALMGSPLETYDELIKPVMIAIGELWHEGTITVGHEHLVTELVTGAARQLLQLAQPAAPRPLCVLACFADEPHALPLYGIGLRLASQGCRVHVLGPRTPPLALAPAVRTLAPVFVGLSVTSPPEPSRMRELIDGYALACGDCPWLVGGLAASGMRASIERAGGHLAEQESVALTAQLQRLLGRQGALA